LYTGLNKNIASEEQDISNIDSTKHSSIQVPSDQQRDHDDSSQDNKSLQQQLDIIGTKAISTNLQLTSGTSIIFVYTLISVFTDVDLGFLLLSMHISLQAYIPIAQLFVPPP
jgi:hypothetical protein